MYRDNNRLHGLHGILSPRQNSDTSPNDHYDEGSPSGFSSSDSVPSGTNSSHHFRSFEHESSPFVVYEAIQTTQAISVLQTIPTLLEEQQTVPYGRGPIQSSQVMVDYHDEPPTLFNGSELGNPPHYGTHKFPRALGSKTCLLLFKNIVQGNPVPILMDNTTVVSYITSEVALPPRSSVN